MALGKRDLNIWKSSGATNSTLRTLAKASSLAAIQLFKSIGCLIIKGAIPRPVELPIPNLRRSDGFNFTAVSGAFAWAICSTRSITKVLIKYTVSIST